MKLIIGLGNIGDNYAQTRHNIGFMVVDELARRLDTPFESKPKLQSTLGVSRSALNVLLAKPTTMMNLSGQAAQALTSYYKIDTSNVWVVYDELDMDFGQLRVRRGGGTAGHNGVRSMVQHIGEDFWRIRLGIRNEHLANTPADRFVLDQFNASEKTQLPKLIKNAADYIESALESGQLDDHTHALLFEQREN